MLTGKDRVLNTESEHRAASFGIPFVRSGKAMETDPATPDEQ